MRNFKVWIDGFGAPEDWEADSICQLLLCIRDAVVAGHMDDPKTSLRIELDRDWDETEH